MQMILYAVRLTLHLSFIAIAMFAGISLAAAQSLPLAEFAVHAGKFDRINTPVSVILEGVQLNTASTDLQLYEVTAGKEEPVPSQLEPGYQNSIWWVLTGETPAGTVRYFELRQTAKQSGPPAPAVQLNDDGKAIHMSVAGKEVLAYHYAKPPVPEGVSEVYSRAGFIHPLRSPAGAVLTRIQPPDHYHHYGIWNPWTHTEYKGKEVDFWNLAKEQGTVRVNNISTQINGPVFGQVQAVHDHVVFSESQAEPETALNEQLAIRVWNADPQQKVWLVDFTSTMNCATDNPLTIKEYRYEGFGFRATEKWNDQTATLLTSSGKDKSNGNGTRARWCDVNGVTQAGRSGILFMTYPANYNYPEQIRIWPTGMNEGKENVFFNFNPTQDRDWILEPGNAYTLKYRMMVYDGKIDSTTAERYWHDFANPPRVDVQTLASLQGIKALVYTHNGEGYVHENRAASVAAIKKLGKTYGFTVDASDDPAIFTQDNMQQYDVLIFSNTNNEAFDTEAQKQVFQEFIRSGKGFVGIHSASGSERNWPWFAKMLGGRFVRHPKLQPFTIKKMDNNHPSTAFLPDHWQWEDECYYHKNINPDIHVLLAADLSTVEDDQKEDYPGDIFGGLVPLSWCHEFDGGREWYTALGHKAEYYENPEFLRHILGGIIWAVGDDQP